MTKNIWVVNMNKLDKSTIKILVIGIILGLLIGCMITERPAYRKTPKIKIELFEGAWNVTTTGNFDASQPYGEP